MSRQAAGKDLLAAVRAEAKARLDDARGSHDWDHTERVLCLCLHIGRRERADLIVLRLAALLHDIGRAEEDRTNGRTCHAEAGAREARVILEKHGLPEATIASIVHCIGTHRYRKAARPETLEARILFDADKLDSIGAVGIGRAFLFAGEVGARMHDPAVDVEKTKPYTKEDTAYREFLVKLRHIRDRMTTAEGKRLARGRHAFMTAYFRRLNKETAGSV
ncbi:MAG: HD domain-containing protein [Candidatus Aminicenantes bacterium]|nr:HD domain-containing protein [Candidatus Aminicenantes bacterium]